MNRLVIPVILAASVFQVLTRPAAAQPAKGAPTKGAPAKGAPVPSAGSADQGPVVVLGALKAGDAVRVKWHNEWTDGTVVQVSGSQVQVQIGGSRDWFMAEKVWGTEEARDNEAAGGYLDPTTRENFEAFKVVVAELEAVKASGADAATLREAIDAAEQVLEADYGKAGQHPRAAPVLARYWAVATVKLDWMVAEVVAASARAVETTDTNFFLTSTDVMLMRAAAVLAQYQQFQTTASAETARLQKVLADARQKIDADRSTVAAAALAAARVPKEIYKGSDKKALKAKISAEWKKRYPDRPILKLVASTEWDRQRTWKTNASAAGGYWYDWTTLTMYLVAKKDATTATVYPVGVTYPDGNKKKLVVSASEGGYGNYVPYDMLLKNVK